MVYVANEARYEDMRYNRCGNSGLKLPAILLGLWQNWIALRLFFKRRMKLDLRRG